MYFVDRIKIEQMLRFLEAQLTRFEEKQDWNRMSLHSLPWRE